MQNDQLEIAVNSFDEWTQLEEVIVGHIDGFKGYHLDKSFSLFYWSNIQSFVKANHFFKKANGFSWPIIEIDDRVVDELKEDIQGFVDTLENLGVKVRRPAPITSERIIRTPFWQSNQLAPLNVRDNTIILGSTILETAPHIRARLFENDYLKPLFYEYMSKGAKWLIMPRPTLSANLLDTSFFSLENDAIPAFDDSAYVHKLEALKSELVFDGAQCIRIGRDVLVNVANKNHELGFQWLQSVFGNTFKFHRLSGIADSHIDSMVIPLRPGLLILRDKKTLNYLPDALRKWDHIVAPEPQEDQFPSYFHENHKLSLSSIYLDINILSINENTVIANPQHKALTAVLESYGFNVVPVRHRHRRLFGGGFHCFTLDIRRKGVLQSYL